MLEFILSLFLQDPIIPPPPPDDEVWNEDLGDEIPDAPVTYAPILINSDDWRRMQDRKSNFHVYIYISDQDDFETDFVRQTFEISNEVLSKQLRSKFPGHLEKWLYLRRTLKYCLIINPELDGPPEIAFQFREFPRPLIYPYKALSDHTIFLEHLHYITRLSRLNTPDDIVTTEYFEFGFGFRDHKGAVKKHKITLCVDDIKFDASPLLGYQPYFYTLLDDEIIITNGPTVEEQFNLLDAGTGFLVKKK
jgi:hypothetical protein